MTVSVPKPIASDLREIGRYIEDTSNEEIEKPRNTALKLLVDEFIQEHKGQFIRKEPAEEEEISRHVYVGEQSTTPKKVETTATEEVEDDVDTEGHLTFSLQGGPPK